MQLKGRRTSTIGYEDVAEKLETLNNIDGFSPVMNSSVYLKNKDKESFSTSCIGANQDYATVQDMSIQEGRFLTSFDIDGKMNVVVIGTYVANEIFGEEKAIGARKRNIMIQFLIESLIITGIAGLTGIGIGNGIIFVIGKMEIVPAVYSIDWMIISFNSSLIIGVIFGIFPAYKAATIGSKLAAL